MSTFTSQIFASDAAQQDTPNTDREEARQDAIMEEEDRIFGMLTLDVVVMAEPYRMHHDSLVDALEMLIMGSCYGYNDVDEISEIIYGMKMCDVMALARERAGMIHSERFTAAQEEIRQKVFHQSRAVVLHLILAVNRLARKIVDERNEL